MQPHRPATKRLIAGLAVGAVVAGLLLISVRWRRANPTNGVTETPPSGRPFSRPEPRPSDYAGSRACADCHPDISEQYQTHPMSRSLHEIPDPDLTELTSDVRIDVPGRRSYGIEIRDDGVVHYEEFLDAEGRSLYRQDEAVSFAIGSGIRGRTYVINHEGLLFQSPLGWYAGGPRWDLSPGYEPADHPRFERRIADGCLACHAGRVRSLPDAPHRFAAAPFAEASIGCERCHGPGQAHIDYWNSDSRIEATDPIVNPIRLDPVRRDSVCYQCHLHGVKRIPCYGRTEFDFRPGDRLCDNWTVFVDESGSRSPAGTRAVSQVEQMLESRCRQQSGDQLSCLSCHSPHGVPAPNERVSFYRERCLACHDSGETECAVPVATRVARIGEDSCIACHMPRFAAGDVPHTAQTDHRIIRSPASPPAASEQKRNLIVFAAGGAPQDEEIHRAEGILWSSIAEQSGNRQAAANALHRLEPLVELLPDDSALFDALLMANLAAGRAQDARIAGERALGRSPRNEAILEGLVLACARQGDSAAGLSYADSFLELNPWQSGMHEWRAEFLMRLGKPEDAIEAAERAIELNPLSRRARSLLVELYGQTGREALQTQQTRMLEVLDAESTATDGRTRGDD